MNDVDKTLMAQHGITGSPGMVYFYRQYRYENLVDALNYARIGCMHAGKDTLQVPV